MKKKAEEAVIRQKDFKLDEISNVLQTRVLCKTLDKLFFPIMIRVCIIILTHI
jgi:hypothetical protein